MNRSAAAAMFGSVLLTAGVGSACAGADDTGEESTDAVVDVASTEGPVAVPGITLVATDYGYQVPQGVTAGRTAVRLVNQGAEAHHVQMVRLAEGKTLEDLLAAYAAGDHYPEWATDVGGPNAVLPGGAEFTAVVDLKPGLHALLCVIPSPDGQLHVMKGMSGTMMVAEAAEAAVSIAAAEPAITLDLNDYGFAFSEVLTAGTHEIRVRGNGRQSHEFVVFRLEDGKAPQDIAAFFETGQQGPPPAVPVGGVVGLTAGEFNDITMTFEPGRYAFICFLPDIESGAPHFTHGMMQEYQIS